MHKRPGIVAPRGLSLTTFASKKDLGFTPYHFSQKSGKGFTLIELLVVMTIIGVVSGLGYVNFDNAQDKARDARRKEDLKAIKTALVSYYQDHDAYPPLCDPLQPPPCAKGAAFISNTTRYFILNLYPLL